MTPLFVVKEKLDCNIPEQMNIYEEKAGAKTIKGTKNLLGVMKAKKILLYTPKIRWYLQHGLAKLRMLEFYYDFLDKHFSRQDLELCYMDTDSFYFAMSGDSLGETVKPEMKQAYEADKKNWFATDEFSERTVTLIKSEFVGTSGVPFVGVWLTAKYYLVENQNKIEKNKYNCEVVQTSIVICVLNAIRISWMFSKRQE